MRFADLYNRDHLLRALTREGGRVQSGVIITRKDIGINKVEDLKGRAVMFGLKLSATNWIVAKLLLKEKVIDIDRDLKAYSKGRHACKIIFHSPLLILHYS